MPDLELINKSVTKDDYAETPRGGVINFMVPWYPGSAVGLPPEPPQWWTPARDYTLRSTVLYEDMWAAAIGIAITKIASSSWEVDSEIPLRARRGQDVINNSDWVKLFAKGLRDYLTTDNGQFIEIVRAAKSPVSTIVGLAHLDSLRCTRTGDPEIPVIYKDRKGREHELRGENIIALSDMPDPGDTWYGVGNCAASRAYRSIYKLSVIDWYVSEKVSGRRPLAIHFVSSVGQRQLEGIITSAEEGAARQGLLSYMGAIVVPLMDASTAPEVATVPLAELPDRFNRKEEFDIALYSYADNIGLDIQDLQPLTGQPLGTGAQSQVLDEKAKGKGLVIWKKDLAYELNQKVFDDLTTFAWIEKDYRDQERQAAVSNARATASKTRVDAGITTPAQEMQVLVDLDELPNEFLPTDVTGETLSDEEKPDKETTPEETQAVDETTEPGEQPEKEETRQPETKETIVGRYTSKFWKLREKQKELGLEPIELAVPHYPQFEPSSENGVLYWKCKQCETVYSGSFSAAQKEHAENGLTAFPGFEDFGMQTIKANLVEPTIPPDNKTTQEDLDKLYLQELNDAVKLYQDAGGEMPKTPGMKETLKEVVLRWFKADEKDEEDESDDEGNPGPFQTARQRKWFFSGGPGSGASSSEHYGKGEGAKKTGHKKQPSSEPSGEYKNHSETDAIDSHNTFHPAYQKWVDDLPKDQEAALSAYTNGSYGHLNAVLRHEGYNPHQYPNSQVTKLTQNIDNAIDSAPGLPVNTMLYRGFGSEDMYNAALNGAIKPGDVISEPSFLSTSPKRMTAVGFEKYTNPVFYVIKADKGAKGAYVTFPKINKYMHEAEMLLPRNSSFTVVSAGIKNYKGLNVAVYELRYK